MGEADDMVETLSLVGPVAATGCLSRWLPRLRDWAPDCLLVEVGSTGVPGLSTKGDVDVAVVAPDRPSWQDVVLALRVRLTPHEPEHWSATWASFHGDSAGFCIGVQLVLSGGEEDEFLRGFRGLLFDDAAVVERYAALKARHLGGPMRDYREAKGRFVEAELAAKRRGH